jgi:probable F420-dependent oxidoreductase
VPDPETRPSKPPPFERRPPEDAVSRPSSSPNVSDGSRKAFRFAVVAARLHDAGSWRRLCRDVEELGYSSLYLPDTCAPQMGPLVALATAAAHTQTLRVGMLVANNELRNPALLARELATLDVLSAGRLEWGMGAGWFQPDHHSIGLPFDPAAVRVDRMIEAVELMQRIFSESVVTHEGRHYTVADLGGAEPVQKPHPPLLIGAAERRMLTFAGKKADRVNVTRSFSTASFGGRPPRKRPDEAIADQIAWISAGAGGRFNDIEISLEVNPPLVVTTDRGAALARLSESTGLSPEQVMADPRNWVGSTQTIVESLQGHRDRYGVSHWVVYEQYLRDAAPIVAELAGR